MKSHVKTLWIVCLSIAVIMEVFLFSSAWIEADAVLKTYLVVVLLATALLLFFAVLKKDHLELETTSTGQFYHAYTDATHIAITSTKETMLNDCLVNTYLQQIGINEYRYLSKTVNGNNITMLYKFVNKD